MNRRYPESFEVAIESEPYPNEFWEAVDSIKHSLSVGMEKFTNLANSDSTLSMYMLGDIYFWSYRGLRQGDLGMKWLRRAAERSSIEAAYQLGRAHKALKDDDAAIEIFSELCSKNFSPAMFQLGSIYLRRNNLTMCEKYYRLGYEVGNFPARQNLSIMMARGQFGVAKIGTGIKSWTSLFRDYHSLIKDYPESDIFRGSSKQIRGSSIGPVLRASLLLLE